MFCLQSRSFLGHQQRLDPEQGQGNGRTLFGMEKIPSDTQIRAMLDPATPTAFDPVFADVVCEIERCGGSRNSAALAIIS